MTSTLTKAVKVTMLFGMFATIATAQLRGWHIAPNLIDMQTTTPVVKPAFTTNLALKGANSIYDSEGKLLFYIGGATGSAYRVCNKFNQVIGTLPQPYISTSEIAIVPNPDNGGCISKYYIIYPQGPVGTLVGHFTYYEVDMAANNGLGQLTLGTTAFSSNVSNPTANPLAVSKLVTGKRFLYVIGNFNSQVAMYTITNTGISTTPTYISAPFISGSLTNELELSNAGDKIAYYQGGNTISVLPLNPATGLASGAPVNFTTPTSLPIYGLEFDNSGNKLYYSTGSSIIVIDLTTSVQTTILSSAAFSKSMLEKNYNGTQIMCASTTQIKGIDIATNTLNPWAVAYSLPYFPSNNFVLMPDQIDGENYDVPNVINVDVDQLTLTAGSYVWTPTSNPAYTANVLTSVYPNPAGLPLRIATGITQLSGASLLINSGLHINFETNAYHDVRAGATLNIANSSVLEGHPCGLMWRGVSVNSNAGTTPTYYYMQTSSKVFDALKGVVINGTNVTSLIIGGSTFNKNEVSLVYNSASTSNTNIYNANFLATLPLKDQTKGQVITGGTIKYGITGIEVNNCGTIGTPIKIGSSASVGNYFESGQYGIKATNSELLVQKNTFKFADRAAIDGNANWTTRNLTVLSNTFDGNRTDNWLIFNYNLNATKNTYSNTKEFSIRWHYNTGSFQVGSTAGTTDANTFTNFGYAAINISNCDQPTTDIKILSNNFINAPAANGVLISEPTLTSATKTYKGYNIKDNTFTNVVNAVKVTNIKGDAVTTGTDWNGDVDLSYTSRYDIWGNIINFTNSYDINARGIKVENCIKNRAITNTVTCSSNTDWQNTGIEFTSTPQSLIKGNYVKAGAGIRLNLELLNSNILCNRLDNCVIGLGAGWSWLRPTGAIHGSIGVNGRQNYFLNPQVGTIDIQMYYSGVPQYQWASPNTTNIVYISSPGSIIASTTDPNPCGGLTLMSGMAATSTSADEQQYQTSSIAPPSYASDVELVQNNSQLFKNALTTINTNPSTVLPISNINTLAKAQVYLNNGDATNCKTQLLSLGRTSSVTESNLATVLNIQATLKQENRITYTSAEKSSLIAIAQTDSRLGGQGVYYARAILMANYNLHYNDGLYDYQAPTKGVAARIGNTTEVQAPNLLKGIYPNPTSTELNIVTNSGFKTITIYNNLGQIVYNTQSQGLLNIDVSAWAKGVYVITVIDIETKATENSKFIVK